MVILRSTTHLSEPDFPYDKRPRDVPSRAEKMLPEPKEIPALVSDKPSIPILGVNSSILTCQKCGRIFNTEEDLNLHSRKNHRF